jgi:hypothetical protein
MSRTGETLDVAPGTVGGALSASATTADQALPIIETFRTGAGSMRWGITRDAYATRLVDLVKNPDLFDQGGLNLCGPAVVMRSWARRDPVAYVRYAIDLYEKGTGSIGSLTVSPGSDMLNANYPTIVPRMNPVSPPADWATMGALRDSANWFWDFEGTPEEDFAAINMPREVTNWMKATGLYRNVRNEGNWFITKGLDHAKNLQPGINRDIILLINSHLLKPVDNQNRVMSAFPNHYIALLSPITESGGVVTFDYWSWGAVTRSAMMPTEQFESNYYGAVIAEGGQLTYDVRGGVPIIGQAKSKDCWAASATMMVSWRDQASHSVDDVVNAAGPPYPDKYANNTGIAWTEARTFLNALGLRDEPPADYSAEQVLDFLKLYGPLWVTTEESPAGSFAPHARIITGIFGDGTPDGTFLRLNNPLPVGAGSQNVESYRSFMAKFDELALEEIGHGGVGVQIFHF